MASGKIKQSSFLEQDISENELHRKGNRMTNPSQADVSAKNTKNEILEAYQELLKKVTGSQPVSHQEAKREQEKREILTQATDFTTHDIVNHLAQMKLAVCQSLDTLEEKLNAERQRLGKLQAAIIIEENRLNDLHEISVNVHSLDALMQGHKEYSLRFEQEREQAQKQFEQEVHAKRLQWKKEQDEFAQKQKEIEANGKKERERDEEEYQYNTQLERKKDHDLYDERSTALEKELLEKRTRLTGEFALREAAVKEREEEFKTLKLRVDQFPKELEKAVKDAEKALHDRLESEYRYATELSKKESEGERKLNQQIVSSLREKIKEQDELIRQLTQKANDAGIQVQSIALKALEGASGFRSYSFAEEKKSAQQGA